MDQLKCAGYYLLLSVFSLPEGKVFPWKSSQKLPIFGRACFTAR